MRSARIVLPLLAVVALFTAASAAGGGGKDQPGSTSNPLVAVPNPATTRVPSNEGPVASEPRRPDPTPSDPSTSTRTQQGSTALHRGKPMVAAPETPRQQKDQPTSASRPCSLVTKDEAQEILGAPIVEPLQAPQGPTCIYRAKSAGHHITLAAQDASIDELQRRLSGARAVSVNGRAAFCGTLGGPVLYLPLSDRRTLVVAASCEIARRFAALALARA